MKRAYMTVITYKIAHTVHPALTTIKVLKKSE